MTKKISVLAKEFGHGDITAIFYFVEQYSMPKFANGFFQGYVTEDVIRCVKVRCPDRTTLAKTMIKFRNARRYLREYEALNGIRIKSEPLAIGEAPTIPMKRHNMLWLANRWTICYLHDGKNHLRYTFRPHNANETPWWITP